MFDEIFDKGIEALLDKKAKFGMVKEDPELILTELFNPKLSQPYYEFPFMAFGKGKELIGNEKLHYHQMQSYLVQKLYPCLKEYDSEIDLKHHKSRYPSDCIIYYGEEALLVFNFYQHIFSDARKCDDNYFEKQLISAESVKSTYQKELNLFSGYLKNPKTLAKNFKDRIYLFTHKDLVKKNLPEKVAVLAEKVAKSEENIAEIKQQQAEYLTGKEKSDQKYEFWRQFFLDIGYKEKEKIPCWQSKSMMDQ